MSNFNAYKNSFPNARLTRSESGVLEVALHTDGGKLVFNGHTHEQFVDLFHAIGEDRDNRVVILTGSGDAFMDAISPEGFDFFSPRGYDKIFREGRKVLMNILDIEVPMITALNGPVLLHSEYALLTDIILATPETVFQDKPHFDFGIVPGDGVQPAVAGGDRLDSRPLFHPDAAGARRRDGEGMGRRQRDRAGRPTACPRPRDRRRDRRAAAADQPLHAHRPHSEAAPDHRRGRRLRPGARRGSAPPKSPVRWPPTANAHLIRLRHPSSRSKIMTLQSKLDAFKADFEAGKPPYNVPYSVIETMHRATAELIASGAAQKALKAGDRLPVFAAPRSRRQHGFVRRPSRAWPAGHQLLSRSSVPLLQHGTPGPSGSCAAVRGTRREAGGDLAAEPGQQPQVGAAEQPVLPDLVRTRTTVWPPPSACVSRCRTI